MAKSLEEITPRNSSDLQWYEWLIPGYREGRLLSILVTDILNLLKWLFVML